MPILQGGAPKCGNFWLYQIIRQVLQETGRETGSFISQQPIYSLAKDWDLNYPSQASIDVLDITDLQYSYRISSIFRMPVTDIRAYVARTRHVWTHSPICKKSDELLPLFDKKVYIIRDPRDRAVSAARYYTSGYMLKYYPQEEKDPGRFLAKNFQSLMQEWVWHVFDHLRLSQRHDIHLTFYEAWLLDFQQELSRLLHYLEIDLLPGQRQALARDMHFSNLQKTNPKHLRKGVAGYWKEALNQEQMMLAEQLAGPLIRFLHYPAKPGEALSAAPAPAHRDFERLKQEIITSQLPLYQNS